MFCISVCCFPRRQVAKSRPRHRDPSLTVVCPPPPRTRNMSVHRLGNQGAVGMVGNLPKPQAGPGSQSSGRDRETDQERGRPSHQPGPSDSQGEGFPEHLPVAPPRALQGVRVPGWKLRILDPHLPSLIWGHPWASSSLSCEMGMKASPSFWGGGL